MNIDDKNMVRFIENITSSPSINGFRAAGISTLNNIPLSHKECIYVLDFVKNEVIYSRGFENVLGYPDEEITLEFIINNHHPDDNEIVNRISKAVILYSLEHPKNVLDNVLFIAYKRRKKDGSYIKVLSESYIYEVNDKGIITKGLSKITDISFLDTTDTVNWTFESSALDKNALRKQVYKAYDDFFTEREKEIIREISNGLTTNSIANKLNISEYTVATHRKHIFKKSNRHNTIDLINFCKRKGVL